jgi:hypothetical protein
MLETLFEKQYISSSNKFLKPLELLMHLGSDSLTFGISSKECVKKLGMSIFRLKLV